MSLTNFSAIDLSRFPTPTLIEALSYEDIYTNVLAEFQSRFSEFDALVESDPVLKVLEAFAYREMLLRQRINESAEHVLLAKASSKELDYLGSRFGVERAAVLSHSEDNTSENFESDERFRQRIKLALEGHSTAGPAGAYTFHAFTASPAVHDVHVDAPEFAYIDLPEEIQSYLPANTHLLSCTRNANLSKPAPGDVVVTVLSNEGNGAASESVLSEVKAHLEMDDVRPLTDRVNVVSADIIEFNLEATLYFYPGMNAAEIIQGAKASVNHFFTERAKLGHDISISALHAALHIAGVQRAEIHLPTQDILINQYQAAHCLNVSIHDGGEHV